MFVILLLVSFASCAVFLLLLQFGSFRIFFFLFINTRERVYLDKNKVCKRMFSIVCCGIFDGKTQTDTNAIRILTFM